MNNLPKVIMCWSGVYLGGPNWCTSPKLSKDRFIHRWCIFETS